MLIFLCVPPPPHKKSIKHHPLRLIGTHYITVKKEKKTEWIYRPSERLWVPAWWTRTWIWDVVKCRDTGEGALTSFPHMLHYCTVPLPIAKRVEVLHINPRPPFLGYRQEVRVLQWLGAPFLRPVSLGDRSQLWHMLALWPSGMAHLWTSVSPCTQGGNNACLTELDLKVMMDIKGTTLCLLH